MSDAPRDYTAGDSIPVEDMIIGGDGVMETDANEVAANNVSGTLPPGNYVLRVVGFAKKTETVFKKVFFNGQLATYQAISIGVILADENNTGTMFQNLLLPPTSPEHLKFYNHGKAKADSKTGGFFGNQFVSFVGSLIPNSIVKGEPMKPIARNLKNWIGRKVWAQVEMDKGGYVKEGIDPTTDEPYAPSEPKPTIKLFSYREHVVGGPCPYGASQASAARKPVAARQPAAVGAGASTNGYHAPEAEDNGLGDI